MITSVPTWRPFLSPYILRRHKPLFLCTRRLFSKSCSASLQETKQHKQRVIVISGPTGAGKTRLALELAKRLNGEIISADSVQVYEGLDIGSAKPLPSERKEVPHHLIDILHPSEDYSVGKFFEDARQATTDILNRGRVPIVTGGTGLYLRWFIYGKPDVPEASQEISSEVYTELVDFHNNGDWDAAVEFVVKAGDPKVQSLAVNDWYRLKRSLEILKSSGLPPSSFQVPYNSFRKQFDSSLAVPHSGIDPSALGSEKKDTIDLDYDFICFFLSTQRLDLYRSIDLRCEEMVSGSNGILAEAKWLLDIGLLPNSNSATRAIGYRQAMEYLLRSREHNGQTSPGEFYAFLSEFQKASRNFAKRQLTWFRNELIYHWLDASRPLVSHPSSGSTIQMADNLLKMLLSEVHDKVLDFIYDSYHDRGSSLVIPEWLEMQRHVVNRAAVSALKAYRPKNRQFINRNDCSDILEWVRAQV